MICLGFSYYSILSHTQSPYFPLLSLVCGRCRSYDIMLSSCLQINKSVWCLLFSGICFYVLELRRISFLPTVFLLPLLYRTSTSNDEAYNSRVFGRSPLCMLPFIFLVLWWCGVTSLTNSLYYRATTPTGFIYFRSAPPLAPVCHVMMCFWMEDCSGSLNWRRYLKGRDYYWL
jgi:hypothetical protein